MPLKTLAACAGGCGYFRWPTVRDQIMLTRSNSGRLVAAMWDNLLSGALGSILGSVLGVLGAYYLAVRTLTETRKNERILIEVRQAIRHAREALSEFRRKSFIEQLP